MIRTSWVGQDIVFEEELGGFRINLQWTRQTALIARIDGVPQLFLERRTIALGAAGVIYVHLPTDGHDSIRVVAGELLAGNDRPRTLADHVVGPLLWLVSLPLSLAFLTFFLGMFAFLATSLSGAWFGWPTPLAEPGVEMMVLFGILFFGSLLHLALTWALSRWLGEPVGATIARQRLGVPDHLQPMGTWQGVLSKSGWAKRQLTVWLQVMTAVGARRWLVMMRTHRSASSARVALFATPADQVPGLLRALDAFRDLPPAVAGSSPTGDVYSPVFVGTDRTEPREYRIVRTVLACGILSACTGSPPVADHAAPTTAQSALGAEVAAVVDRGLRVARGIDGNDVHSSFDAALSHGDAACPEYVGFVWSGSCTSSAGAAYEGAIAELDDGVAYWYLDGLFAVTHPDGRIASFAGKATALAWEAGPDQFSLFGTFVDDGSDTWMTAHHSLALEVEAGPDHRNGARMWAADGSLDGFDGVPELGLDFDEFLFAEAGHPDNRCDVAASTGTVHARVRSGQWVEVRFGSRCDGCADVMLEHGVEEHCFELDHLLR